TVGRGGLPPPCTPWGIYPAPRGGASPCRELGDVHRRYLGAAPPAKGETATLAYRLRLLYLDRWNLWPRLTRYCTWQGPNGKTLDGTNNGSERQPPAGLVWQSPEQRWC
ncbi:MAG: hypothetical protein JXA14_08020, partial [Anaerolineae bacterium]|nr:hypothetical protein [Anaerolineae bacterium]